MWERDLTRNPKPFYRRIWFLIPAILLGIVTLAVFVTGVVIVVRYEARARQFNIAQLDQMESASLIYDRNNKLFGQIFIQNRDTIPASEIPASMVNAVVAAEDNRFFSHQGVDFVGVVRAVVANFRAKRTREGASTVTQQLARNTFGLFERTYDRKVVEMFLAREIERQVSKQKIMELYLNRVYFGQGFFGVQSAARGYFGKPASELSLSESATLAGLLKSPNRLSPWSDRRSCLAQRDFVLGRMLELGLINQESYDSARRQDLIVKNRAPVRRESYAIDLIRQRVVAQMGPDNAFSDGYRIYTTIDSDLQKKAESSLQRQLETIERRKGYEHQTYASYAASLRTRNAKDVDAPAPAPPEYLQGAVVALDNDTGGILAIVGGRDFSHSEYNRAIQARRPAGTAFKPLVYAAAFEKGIFPGTVVQDSVIDNRQVMIGGTTGILGEWGPERVDNKYEGGIPARVALIKSKNAATVRFGMLTGLDSVLALARSAGIESPLRKFPATFLGSSEVTPMELTLAYTMFPGGGTRPTDPFVVQRVEEKNGRILFRQKRAGKQRVIEPSTAYEIHTALSEVLDTGTADKAYLKYGLRKFPLGGKTGTAYNFTDDWFIGYSSQVTCGVWIGFDAPRTPIYRGAFSNEVALPVWVDIMNSTFSTYQPHDFPMPRNLKKYEVCRESGQLATDQCFEDIESGEGQEKSRQRVTYFELATPEQAPKISCTVHGDSHPDLAQQLPPGQWPRAALAVDVEKVLPVMMKAPTVIGDEDPYDSVKPTAVLAARRVDTGELPPAVVEERSNDPDAPEAAPVEEPEVRRPRRVIPDSGSTVESPIKIEAPAPMEF